MEAHVPATESEAHAEPVQVVVVHEAEEPATAAEVVEEHPAVIAETNPAVNTVEEVAEGDHAAVDAVELVDVPVAAEHVEPTEHEPVVEVAATDADVVNEEHAAATHDEVAEATESAQEKPVVEVVQSSEHEPAAEVAQSSEHEPAVEVAQSSEHEPVVEAEQVEEHHAAEDEKPVEVVEVPAVVVDVLKEEEAAASHEVVESPAEPAVEEHANTDVVAEAAGGEEHVPVEDAAAPANEIHGIAVGEPFGASGVDAKLIEAAIEAEERAAESESEPAGSRRALRA